MISVVIPIYNEEEIISILHAAVSKTMNQLDEDWEVVYVNDGSKDSSLDLLLEHQMKDPHVVVVDLSRNWGHMGALDAGLKTARGSAVILMDGDLQDPPEVIPEMVAAWKRGAQVVSAVRRKREEKRKYLAFLFPMFYRVLGMLSDYPIPLNCGIFGLIDRQALDSLNDLTELNRYLPGLRAWVGYRTEIVYYDRQDRVGGEGKLSFLSRIKYALDAICSFSYKPLRVAAALSFLALVFAAVLVGLVAAGQLLATPALEIAAILFVGSCVMFCLWVLGEYLGRTYDEVRARPLSIVNRVYRTDAAVTRRPLTAHEIAPAREIAPAA
jgi:polyisoprenyl-phosphate glycosyltransferase